MWNMPSNGGMPGELPLTTPDCQNPPRSDWLFTVLFMGPPGPNGPGSILPSQVQLPSKNLSCDISVAGLGISGGAAWETTAGIKAMAPAIATAARERDLMCLPPLIPTGGRRPGDDGAPLGSAITNASSRSRSRQGVTEVSRNGLDGHAHPGPH